MKHIFLALVAFVVLAGCNYENVDQSPAIAVADKFYAALKARDGKVALSFFAPSFKSSVDSWPRLLGSMEQKHGAVVSAELLSYSIAALDESPCFMLVYSVKREGLATNEKLFVCRAPDKKSSWAIAGHELTRLDTNQSIRGGNIPTEVGVHVP